MKGFVQSRSVFVFLLLCLMVASTAFVYRVFALGESSAARLLASRSTPTPTLPAVTIPSAGGTTTHTPAFCRLKGRAFQMGIAFPQWSPAGFGGNDSQWLNELPQLRAQTSACWVQMPILLNQASLQATVVAPGQSTPALSSVRYGIRFAHAQGLHVFLTLLVQAGGTQSWAGSISFSTYSQEQSWFEGYWRGILPYLQVAQEEQAEQLALGTEEEWLQEYAPDDLWNTLIARIRKVYTGALTYDMNWTSLSQTPRAWMHNPALSMIGVSAYLPVISSPRRVAPQEIARLWAEAVKQKLDAFARTLQAPVLISEIGYRDSADALYQPWAQKSSAPADPAEQAAACDAALANVLHDTHILGIFFWGWDNVDAFNLKGSQAAAAIQARYRSLQKQ